MKIVEIGVFGKQDDKEEIIVTLQDKLFVAESTNGLLAIGASAIEAFFNLGRAYVEAGLFNPET